MTPRSIVYFERLILSSMALSGVQLYLDWNRIMAAMSDNSTPMMMGLLAFLALVLGLQLLLMLLVSRYRSRIAMWISIVLFVGGVASTIYDAAAGEPMPWVAFTIAETIISTIGYALLFTPTARSWLQRRPMTDRELQNVFN